jgi:hypothetical protein
MFGLQFRKWFATLLLLSGFFDWLHKGVHALREPFPIPWLGLLLLGVIPLGIKSKKRSHL